MCNEWSLLSKTSHLRSDSIFDIKMTLKRQRGIFSKQLKTEPNIFYVLSTIWRQSVSKIAVNVSHYITYYSGKNFQLQFFVISSSCQRLCLADDRKTRVATRDSLLLSFCLSVYSLNSLSLLDNPFIISVFLHCHHLFLSVYSFNLSAFLLSLSFLIDFSVCLFI